MPNYIAEVIDKKVQEPVRSKKRFKGFSIEGSTTERGYRMEKLLFQAKDDEDAKVVLRELLNELKIKG